MSSKVGNLSKEEEVFYAIAQMICRGETHITRYNIGLEAAVSHKTVYNVLNKKINQGIQNGKC